MNMPVLYMGCVDSCKEELATSIDGTFCIPYYACYYIANSKIVKDGDNYKCQCKEGYKP